MAEKLPTQGMVDDGLKGAPDGTNRPVDADPSGLGGKGGQPPRTPGAKRKDFKGGQSVQSYHGTGQLGEEKLGD